MFCRFCGNEITDDSSFCPYCGKKIITNDFNSSDNTIEPTKQDITIIEETQLDDKESEEEIRTTSKSGPFTLLSVGLMVISLITVFVIILYVFAEHSFVLVSGFYKVMRGLIVAFGSPLCIIIVIFAYQGIKWQANESGYKLYERNRGFFTWLRLLGIGYLFVPFINLRLCHFYIKRCLDYPPYLFDFIRSAIKNPNLEYYYDSYMLKGRSIGVNYLLQLSTTSSFVCIITGVILLVSSFILQKALSQPSKTKRVILVFLQIFLLVVWGLYGAIMIIQGLDSNATYLCVLNMLQIVLLGAILMTFIFPQTTKK